MSYASYTQRWHLLLWNFPVMASSGQQNEPTATGGSKMPQNWLWGRFLLNWKLFLLLHSMALQVRTTWHVKASWQKVRSEASTTHCCFSVGCAGTVRWEFRLKLSFHWFSMTYGDFNGNLFDLNSSFPGCSFREAWESLSWGGWNACFYKWHLRMAHDSHFSSLLHQLPSVVSMMAT